MGRMTQWQYACLVVCYHGELPAKQRRVLRPAKDVLMPTWTKVWHGPEGERVEEYEYGDAATPVRLLNECGAQGWEAVSLTRHADESIEYLLKRRTPAKT